MLPWLASQTVTRLRGTVGNDSHNSDTLSWVSPSRLELDNCSVQPVQATEAAQTGDTESRWRFRHGDIDADVRDDDRIEWAGNVYEIDGSVQQWTDTTGNGFDHIAAVLRRFD